MDDAATAHHLCEKYRNSASDDVMGQMLGLSQRFDAADSALRAAIQAGEVDGLRRALHEHLLAASRKLVDISVSLLAKLEADFGLRSAPADQHTLRAAIEMHAAAASKEMLDNAKARLQAIQVADAALEQAGMPQAYPAVGTKSSRSKAKTFLVARKSRCHRRISAVGNFLICFHST